MDLSEFTYDDTGAKRRFAVSAGLGFDARFATFNHVKRLFPRK